MKLVRRGEQVEGTLHLTPHHLIFCHTPPTTIEEVKAKPRELWITYPIIQICTLRPSPPASHLPSSIRLRCRDFTFVCFCFTDEKKARDVYDSIKAWTCKLGRIEKLYAFTYQPQRPEKDVNGWTIYDARREWRRLGISEKGTDKGWRISRVNTDYGVSLKTFDSSRTMLIGGPVLTNIPCAAACTFVNIRQYPQLCGQISLTCTLTSPDISTPRQQLLHYALCAATCGD